VTGEPAGPATGSPSLRPLRTDELATLAGWLAEPHVAVWWPEPQGLAAVTAHYTPCLDGRDPTELLAVVVVGTAVGFLQRYEVDHGTAWAAELARAGVPAGAVGLGYLVGERTWLRRGVATAAVRAAVAGTWAVYPRATGVAVACQQDNVASWSTLRAAGLTRLWAGQLVSDDPATADRPPSTGRRGPPRIRAAAPVRPRPWRRCTRGRRARPPWQDEAPDPEEAALWPRSCTRR